MPLRDCRYNIEQTIENYRGMIGKRKILWSSIVLLLIFTGLVSFIGSWSNILSYTLIPIELAMLVYGISILRRSEDDTIAFMLYLGCVSAHLTLLTYIGEMKLIDYRIPLSPFVIIVFALLFGVVHYANYHRHHRWLYRNRKGTGVTRYNPWSSVLGTLVLITLYKMYGYRFHADMQMLVVITLNTVVFFIGGIFGTSNIYNYLIIKKLGIATSNGDR